MGAYHGRAPESGAPAKRLGRLMAIMAGLGTFLAATPHLHGQSATVEVASEVRVFPEDPLFPNQRDAHLSPSLLVRPEYATSWKSGNLNFDFEGFARLDAHDGDRTHVDVRRLSLTWLTDRWTVMAGAGRVFWGVTEVNHLVDVVNQTDGVEDIDGEDKLGQPMLNVSVLGSLGALDVYWLPYSRERTFPGDRGRLRGLAPVSAEARYESGAGEWRQGGAARWSHVIGSVDFAVSFFSGNSREPAYVPAAMAGDAPMSLAPFYHVIDQTALELQWTGGATLWKLEALTRGGHGDRFGALAAGVEHTLFQAFGGASDLGLLAEVMADGRGPAAPPTLFDSDLFLGARWALNDVSDTSILGGVMWDWEDGEMLGLFEAERRLRDGWSAGLEARLLANVDPESFVDGLRKDSFVTLRLSRFW